MNAVTAFLLVPKKPAMAGVPRRISSLSGTVLSGAAAARGIGNHYHPALRAQLQLF
jgi:hypothetical protein